MDMDRILLLEIQSRRLCARLAGLGEPDSVRLWAVLGRAANRYARRYLAYLRWLHAA